VSGPGPLTAQLLERVLAEAFPFHLLVDEAGRATRVGPSLRTACPGLAEGAPVEQHLRITSPRATGWTAAPGRSHPRGLVLVAATSGPLVLRGQLLEAGTSALFLGSPWVTSLDALTGLGLRLNDFSAADPVTDLLMLFGAQTSALADAQQLATQLREAAQRQEHQATHDGLTGLINRSRFSALLDSTLESIRGTGGSVGVVLLDMDRFKEINDTLGHQCGDRLLQQLGPRIQGALRANEVVARLGGDEFALLVRSPKHGEEALADFTAITRRVIDAIHVPIVVDDLTLAVEASAGLAMAPDHGSTSEALLQHADVAMYVAKASHTDSAVYSPELDSHEPRRLTLLSRMRAAADDGEFVLYYQPLLHVATDEVPGVEALVRWQHPDEGLLPPGEFVPIAESSGFIHRLTREVLSLACIQAKAWEQAGDPLVVSVNISARCLLDATLPDAVAEVLTRVALPSSLLKLEITESAIIADTVRAQAVIARLRALDVKLSIDDFGTGFTSLAYLRDLPVQELKIDRSFVGTMLTEPKNAILVQTGIELATRLGLESVAEGVEDAATLARLRALGCSTAQGYHIARPMPADALEAWLAQRRRTRPVLSATA